MSMTVNKGCPIHKPNIKQKDMRNFTFKTRWKALTLSCLSVFLCLYTYAQQTLTGKVVDALTNETIIGASVKVKGTSIGTVTDQNGAFKLTVMAGSTLQISFIGYKSIEMPAGSGGLLTIKLSENAQSLNDVVVVGYGTQKRETLTGSVATVSAKAFQDKGALPSPLQALQGQVAGATITRGSSAPGDEGWSIQLRGASSVNATEPLTIIDGVIVASFRELRHLNPSDIDNISFLKDASAAIYGARAAGGVVIVTTKRAKAGKTTISYDASFTFQKPALQPDLMSVSQWANGAITARLNDGYTEDDIWIKYARLALANLGTYVDLSKVPNPVSNFTDVKDFVFFNDKTQTQVLWGNAFSQEHNLSISGRNDKAGYRLSFGYLNQGSMLQWGDNSNKRYNIRLTNDFTLSDKVNIESNISYTRNDQVSPNLLNQAVSSANPLPGFPELGLNGTPYAWGGNYDPTSLLQLGGDNMLRVNVITLNEKLNYKITKDLTFVSTLAFNPTSAIRSQQTNAIQWYNYTGTIAGNINPTQTGSYFSKATNNEDYYTGNAYLEYKKQIKDHHFALTAGTSYERDEYDLYSGMVTDINPSLQVLKGVGANSVQTVAETKYHTAIGSFFGRFNYDYKSKYLIEANARYDGSSKFESADRWKPFYGVSGGWRITQEDFMKSITFLNELKLRASYGELGNQSGINNYDYISQINVNPNSAYFGSTLVPTTSLPGILVSLNRTWERIQLYNLALDFSMFKSRLSGTAEVFMKQNKNMLLPQAFPGVLGALAPSQNIGHLETKGAEGTLNWADHIGEVSYSIGGTISYSKNKLINYGGASLIPTSGFNTAVQGYALNSVFGLKYDGRIQTQQQLDAYVAKFGNAASSAVLVPTGQGNASTKLQLGDNMYKDINGDGKLTQADFVYLGSDDPQISYSFNTGVQWKGFDLNLIFQGVAKRTIFRDGTTLRVPFSAIYLNTTTQSIGDNWTPQNTGAYFPRYSSTGTINNYNYQASDRSVEDGAYLRLKNVTVGYTIPASLLKRLKGISSLRFYVTGTDLWETTKIKDGYDPEATRLPEGVATTVFSRYPFYRSATVGLNVIF